MKVLLNQRKQAEVGTLSVMAIMLSYVFALSLKALTLMRSVIASIIYRTGHIGAVIVSNSYCYKLIDQHFRLYPFLLFHYDVSAFHFINSFE